MKRLLIALSAAAVLPLGACGTVPAPEPIVQTKVVEVPVPTPCKPQLSPEPQYPDTDEALAGVTDVFQGTQLLKAGRKMRIAREGELDAALQGCAGAAQ